MSPSESQPVKQRERLLKFHHPKSPCRYLPQTRQCMQTLLLKPTQQHTEEHQTHTRLHVPVTQTHARGAAVMQTWHV